MNMPMPCRVSADLRRYENEQPREYTAQEDAMLDERADELMAERIKDVQRFKDFCTEAQSVTVDEQVHRALMNIDGACNGEWIEKNAVLSAISNVQRIYKAWCEATYRDECRGEAEHEYAEGSL